MPSRSETRIRTRPALHRKLTDLILDEIHSGRLPLGAKLPSQAELVARYQVSVNTVRQSLATLEKRGIIRKEHGRGSFVSLQSGRREGGPKPAFASSAASSPSPQARLVLR